MYGIGTRNRVKKVVAQYEEDNSLGEQPFTKKSKDWLDQRQVNCTSYKIITLTVLCRNIASFAVKNFDKIMSKKEGICQILKQ